MTQKNIRVTSPNQKYFDSVLAKYFSDIHYDNYDVTFTYTNDGVEDYVVDYTYLVNGYSTKIGYTVIVNNNTIVGIQANNTNYLINGVLPLRDVPSVNEQAINRAYGVANEQVEARKDGSTVTEQKGGAFFDVKTMSFYYRIMTVYRTGAGGYGGFFTFDPIK